MGHQVDHPPLGHRPTPPGGSRRAAPARRSTPTAGSAVAAGLPLDGEGQQGVGELDPRQVVVEPLPAPRRRHRVQREAAPRPVGEEHAGGVAHDDAIARRRPAREPPRVDAHGARHRAPAAVRAGPSACSAPPGAAPSGCRVRVSEPRGARARARSSWTLAAAPVGGEVLGRDAIRGPRRQGRVHDGEGGDGHHAPRSGRGASREPRGDELGRVQRGAAGGAADLLAARGARGHRHGRRRAPPARGGRSAMRRDSSGWRWPNAPAMPQQPAPEPRAAEAGRSAASAAAPSRPPPRAAAWQCSCTTASSGRRAAAARPRSATARSKVTAASATQRARGSPGHQAREVVDQHRPARGLQHDDRARPRGRAGPAASSARRALAPRGRHQALRQQRAPAAAGIDHPHVARRTRASTRRAASPTPGSRKRVKVSAISATRARRGRRPVAGVGRQRRTGTGERRRRRRSAASRPAAAAPGRRPRPQREQRRGRGRSAGRPGAPRARGGGGRGPPPSGAPCRPGPGTPRRRPCTRGRARGPRAGRRRPGPPAAGPRARRAGCTARPRVEWRSSPSAWKLGHIAPAARAAGAVAVARLAGAGEAALGARSSTAVRRGRRGGEASRRRPASSGSGSVSDARVEEPLGIEQRPSGARRRRSSRAGTCAAAARCAPGRRRARPRATRRARHQVGHLLGDPPQRGDRAGQAQVDHAAGCGGSPRWRGRTRWPAGPRPPEVARTSRAKPGSRAGGTAGSSMKGSGRGSPGPPAPPVRRARAMPDAAHGPHRLLGGGVQRPPARRGSPAAARAPRSGSPLCSTIRIAAASPAKPISDRTAGGRLAGSSSWWSISSMAEGPAPSASTTASRASSTDANDSSARPRAAGPLDQPHLGRTGSRPACPRSRTAGAASPASSPAERVERVARDPPEQRGRPRGGGEGARAPRAPAGAGVAAAQGRAGRRRRASPPSARTWSAVSPSTTERAPAELLAIIPPRVARFAVATSAPNISPWGGRGGVEVVQHHAGPDPGDAPRRGRSRRPRARSSRPPARARPPGPRGSCRRPAS